MKQISTNPHISVREDNRRILAENEFVSNNTWLTGLNNNDVIIGENR